MQQVWIVMRGDAPVGVFTSREAAEVEAERLGGDEHEADGPHSVLDRPGVEATCAFCGGL